MRDAEQIRLLAIDPHSPAEFRCNQVVRNLAEFHEAFGRPAGDGLWLDPGGPGADLVGPAPDGGLASSADR